MGRMSTAQLESPVDAAIGQGASIEDGMAPWVAVMVKVT